MNQSLPLVSIILITYNSETYILETLNSIIHQTYPNLELIVSDDCSGDNTVSLCVAWIRQHETFFKQTILLQQTFNTGTAANLNRGINQARGEWVKIVAGDDMLYPDCISSYMAKVLAQPEIEVLFSEIAINGIIENQKTLNVFFSPHVNQYKMLLKNNFLSSPAVFIRQTVFQKTDGFDERYPLFEDYPFFLKALKNGVKFHCIHKELVYYRIHEKNISSLQRLNYRYLQDIVRFFKEALLPQLRNQNLYLYYVHYFLQTCYLQLITAGVIKKASTYQLILKWTGPLFWKLRLQNLFKIY